MEQDPVRLKRVERMVELGVLPEAALERAHQVTVDRARLARWFDVGLLSLGVGLLLAGVVFFFAYNWADLHRFGKLGLLLGLMLGGAGVAWRFWETRAMWARLGLVWASVCVGGALAVFGQTYQTGADAWQLFAGWSALIVCWTVMSRSELQWALWWALVHVATLLFWEQHLHPTYDVPETYGYVALGVANAALLGAHVGWGAMTAGHGFTTARGRRVLTALATTLTAGPAGVGVFLAISDGSGGGLWGGTNASLAVTVPAYAAVAAMAWWLTWKRERDVASLAAVLLGALFVSTAAVMGLSTGLKELFFLPTGVFVLVGFGGLVSLLVGLHRETVTGGTGDV